MKSITQMINEGKEQSIISMFKDGENSMLSMIAKRIENYDKNSGKHSQEPMFLTDENFNFMGWSRVDILKTEVGDPNNSTDKSQLVGLYDGFLNEYVSHKSTKNEKYILGVFIDRCFIPIPDKETFDKIWEKLSKE
jgi:hypothetical protein